MLLVLSVVTLLLLDELTDNLNLNSAEVLEAGWGAFDDIIVIVIHDRLV